MKPATKQAYQLLHEGTLALAEVEKQGMRVDERYLHKTIDQTHQQITQLQKQLKHHKFFQQWKKR